MSDQGQKEFENNVNVHQSTPRRSFLKKTTAGAVITSLPATSVWGACTVSGAMSGNLSAGHADDHTCVEPVLYGLSPGFWKKYTTSGDPAKSPINDKFSQVIGHKDSASAVCYKNTVKAVVSGNSMELRSDVAELYTGPLSLDNALVPSSGGYNFAAVWLNSYFGFYGDGHNSVSMANQRVEEVIIYFAVQLIKNPTTHQTFNFLEGATNYSISSCNNN